MNLLVLHSELLMALELVLCILFIAIFYFYFSYEGLYVYSALVGVLANIQVLKLGKLYYVDEHVALGTIIFTSTYFVTDIITENHGPKLAKNVVGLSFLTMIMVPVFMFTTLQFQSEISMNIDQAIEELFTPAPRLFLASIVSYAASQYLEIIIFYKLKTVSRSKFLLVRSALSLVISAFADSVMFSLLAWYVLSPTPLDLHTIWSSYILSSFGIRLICTAIFAPCLYLFKKNDVKLSKF